MCTKDDLMKPKVIVNKTDVLESCSREKTNTKWRFYKLTDQIVFAILLEVVPMGCRDAFYTNHGRETAQSTASHLKRTEDNHIWKKCVFFVHLLFTCTEIKNLKKNLASSTYSSKEWMDSVPISSREST